MWSGLSKPTSGAFYIYGFHVTRLVKPSMYRVVGGKIQMERPLQGRQSAPRDLIMFITDDVIQLASSAVELMVPVLCLYMLLACYFCTSASTSGYGAFTTQNCTRPCHFACLQIISLHKYKPRTRRPKKW